MRRKRRPSPPPELLDDDCPICRAMRDSGEPLMSFDGRGMCRVDFVPNERDRITVLFDLGDAEELEVGLPTRTSVREALSFLSDILDVPTFLPRVAGEALPLDAILEEGTLIELHPASHDDASNVQR